MFKYMLKVVRQNLLPPPKSGFLSYFLILISKKYFQEDPFFLQISKEFINIKLKDL